MFVNIDADDIGHKYLIVAGLGDAAGGNGRAAAPAIVAASENGRAAATAAASGSADGRMASSTNTDWILDKVFIVESLCVPYVFPRSTLMSKDKVSFL